VVLQQWLDDCSLQVFGGEKFKKHLFHRVQRVEKKCDILKGFHTENFETRRINLTFRYVPTEHIQELHKFPPALQEDVGPYVQELAQHSDYFAEVLAQSKTRSVPSI